MAGQCEEVCGGGDGAEKKRKVFISIHTLYTHIYVCMRVYITRTRRWRRPHVCGSATALRSRVRSSLRPARPSAPRVIVKGGNDCGQARARSRWAAPGPSRRRTVTIYYYYYHTRIYYAQSCKLIESNIRVYRMDKSQFGLSETRFRRLRIGVRNRWTRRRKRSTAIAFVAPNHRRREKTRIAHTVVL